MPKPITPQNVMIEPKPELEKRTRRLFSTDYKLSILQQAELCKYGELGILLRREKLYSNQLAQWRREFAEDSISGLNKSKPGPSPVKSAEQKRIEQLEKEIARLRQQVELKDSCISLQKKALALIEALEQERS